MPSPSSKMRATLSRERVAARTNVKMVVLYLLGLSIVLITGLVVFKKSYDASVEAQRKSKLAKETLLRDDADLKEERVKLKEARVKFSKLQGQLAQEAEDIKNLDAEMEQRKASCRTKRLEKEEHDRREIDDVTWEIKTAAYKRVQAIVAAAEDDQSVREEVLVNQRDEVAALEGEATQLRGALAEQEVDRVLYRVLGNTSRTYVSAYYSRLKRGSYHDSFALNTQAVLREQALGHIDTGFWYTAETGERRGLKVNPSSLLEVLPKKDPLGDTFPRGGVWRSCAVVGWSGLLTKIPQGRLIDDHDAIFRFNDSPTKGYEAFVGRRTTVRMVEDRYHVESRDRPSREQVYQLASSQTVLDEYLRYKGENERESTNLHLLAPNYLQHISRFLKRAAPFGFFGVALAAQKCRQVTVFGMDGSLWRGHLPYRYYDDRQPPPRAKTAAGAMRDEQGASQVLISELARRPGSMIRISEPCLTLHQCYGATPNASAVPISEGGMCACGTPFPIPRPGFCGDANKPRTLLNCFRECPGGRPQCPGGPKQAPCDKLGVAADESPLVGPLCDTP